MPAAPYHPIRTTPCVWELHPDQRVRRSAGGPNGLWGPVWTGEAVCHSEAAGVQTYESTGRTLESRPMRIAVTSAWARLVAPSFW